jgi:hypothetical protein
MRALLLIPLLLLGGCSKFESWFQPEKSAAAAAQPSAWSRTGVSEEQAAADLYSCRQQAEAVVTRDRTIDSDIGGIDPDYGDAPVLREQMDEFGYQKRFEQTTSDCMQKLGYGEAAPVTAEPASGEAAPVAAEPAPAAGSAAQPAPMTDLSGGATGKAPPPPAP